MKTKQCSKCGEVKSIHEFHKNKSTKDGFRRYCKICHCREVAEYTKKNKKKKAKYDQKYRKKNKVKIKKNQREWYIKNRLQLRAKGLLSTKNLSENYLKQQIRQKYKITNELISGELIEDYRKYLIRERIYHERRKEEQGAALQRRVI